MGDAEKVAVGVAGAVTVTWVHAPQLSDSFDSVMEPVFAAELLSAQTRTNHVAADGKVYERVAFVVPLVASVVAVCVPMSVLPAPAALVARWNRLVNPAPVDAPPVFEIVAVSVTTLAVVADVGVTEPVVRLDCAAETVTVVVAATALEAPTQRTEYVVFVVGETLTEPESPDGVKFVPVQLVAFVDDQVRVELPPRAMVVGDVERLAVGTTA